MLDTGKMPIVWASIIDNRTPARPSGARKRVGQNQTIPDMNTRYNGWTNRETWLVNVWANPESQEDLDSLREALEDEVAAMPDGILKDMVDLGAINWQELADHIDGEGGAE